MIRLTRLLILVLAIFPAFGNNLTQTPQRDNRPRTASISGRVTVGGKPVANAVVMVVEVDPQSRNEWSFVFGGESPHRAFIKVRTDGEGRYHATGLTEGAYVIRALSKAYVPSKNSPEFDTSRSVTLDEGEARDNVDLALIRGGVITGRVVDAEDRPLVGGYLQLTLLDENGRPSGGFYFDNWEILRTDDRGVYRLYGLAAGRYILSAGGEGAYSRAGRSYPKTFHPDATDEKQAKVIEVKEGVEVTDIDIRLGVARQTYEAAGRVIDAETGQPLPQVQVMCMEARDKEGLGGRTSREMTTDDQGRFQFTGLAFGRYDLVLSNRRSGSGEHYSEVVRFELSDADVSGLELKAIRGSTVSGIVVLEGVGDPAVKAKLQQASVSVHVVGRREPGADGPAYLGRGHAITKIAGEGGFRLTGAPPGMASFYVGGPQENIFWIKRIEHNGAEINSGFEIRQGEQITGVRIVLAYANGSIRGQVEIAGGQLPEGWQLHIQTAPIGTAEGRENYPAFRTGWGYTMADEKGRFVIERLVAGEYDLTLHVMVRVSQHDWSSAPGMKEIKQRVTVTGGAETPVKITLDPARKQ
ncbi:MAG: carboxypeptidase regulatory-like domain-containing protein [Blastocatellia bacterium]